jgi:hypothetical protein
MPSRASTRDSDALPTTTRASRGDGDAGRAIDG